MLGRKLLIKSKIGKPPGTLTYVGENLDKPVSITIVEYDESGFEIIKVNSIDDLHSHINKPSQNKVRWIDIRGLSDINLISRLGEVFSIHKLILEDAINVYQRPKVEFHEDLLFAVIKKVGLKDGKVKLDQLSIVVLKNALITLRDYDDENFEIIHDRIKAGKGVIRKRGAGYLFYVLVDFMVDKYFIVLEELNERIEVLQEKLMENPEKEDLISIQELKKDAQKTRQSLQPLREAVNSLLRDDSEFIAQENQIYLKDTYDHVIHLIEMIETTRESILALMDIYLSSISNKMNEVMKVLTIIATIFIPLTFIAGVYGMNFDKMPELHWEYGYYVVWGVMLVVGVLLGLFFKKKNWL